MARFPASEPDIAALAVVMIQGLRDSPEQFPTRPVPADALQANLDEYNATKTAAVAAESAARDRIAAKNQALDQLADNMRLDLTYAEVAVKDTDWFVLDWKPPNNGGTPAAYHVERRRRDGGEWEQVAHAIASEELLTEQEAGIEWEFRVYAENRAGVGEPSTVLTLEL